MSIAKNSVVQFHYQLKNEAGDVLENSREHQHPVAYLHGHNNMLEALEAQMAGKAVGDKYEVTLTPKQAYGERNPEAIARVPVKHLQGAKKWVPGMQAVVTTEQGQRQVTVVKVGLKMADVDTNHPYAGLTLTFDVEIVDVREATKEEIAHGHAHGAGGHQH